MASPASIARRNAEATTRTKTACDRIADALGLEPPTFAVSARGGAVFAQLSERDAVAAWLDQVAEAITNRAGPEPADAKPRARKGATNADDL